MIRINYKGRFGNNLFQFATANLFAVKFGQKINNPIKTMIVKYCDHDDLNKSVIFSVVNDENYISLLNNDTKTSYFFDGFFQTPEIVEELNNNPQLFRHSYAPNNDLFVHVRLGDIFDNDFGYMNYDYYDSIIKNINYDCGYISSDSPSNPIVKQLIEKYNLTYFDNDLEYIILFGANANHKVLSLGTFSWWIGFLGNRNNVIFPNPNRSIKWHGEIHTIKEFRLY